MLPVDKAHKTSYSLSQKLCVFLIPFSRYSELFVESRNFSYFTCIWCSSWGWPHWNFTKIFRKLCPWAMVTRCFRDPTFSRFNRTPNLWRTDRRTQGHSIAGKHCKTHCTCCNEQKRRCGKKRYDLLDQKPCLYQAVQHLQVILFWNQTTGVRYLGL